MALEEGNDHSSVTELRQITQLRVDKSVGRHFSKEEASP